MMENLCCGLGLGFGNAYDKVKLRERGEVITKNIYPEHCLESD